MEIICHEAKMLNHVWWNPERYRFYWRILLIMYRTIALKFFCLYNFAIYIHSHGYQQSFG